MSYHVKDIIIQAAGGLMIGLWILFGSLALSAPGCPWYANALWLFGFVPLLVIIGAALAELDHAEAQ